MPSEFTDMQRMDYLEAMVQDGREHERKAGRPNKVLVDEYRISMWNRVGDLTLREAVDYEMRGRHVSPEPATDADIAEALEASHAE